MLWIRNYHKRNVLKYYFVCDCFLISHFRALYSTGTSKMELEYILSFGFVLILLYVALECTGKPRNNSRHVSFAIHLQPS